MGRPGLSPFRGLRPQPCEDNLREFDDHGVTPRPGIHDVPASGTPAMAAASTVSATRFVPGLRRFQLGLEFGQAHGRAVHEHGVPLAGEFCGRAGL